MKTLSFVKQAMAVALLISAVNASAMNFIKSIPGYVRTGLTLDESAAQFVLRKALGGKPADAHNPAQAFFGDVGIFRAKNWTGVWKPGKPGSPEVPEVKDEHGNVTRKYKAAVLAVPAQWSQKPDESGKPYVRNVLGFIENHQIGATRVARVAKVAAYAAVAYGLYKWYTAKADVAQDEVQPEAQPEVVVETTQAEVEAPVKVVRQQPAA